MATPPLFISYARGSCECLPDCHSVALCVGCFRFFSVHNNWLLDDAWN